MQDIERVGSSSRSGLTNNARVLIEENDCRPELYEDGGSAFPKIERSGVA